MVFKKADIEASLQEEQNLIHAGKLREDSPLDLSSNFSNLCEACRRGDLQICQETITSGANINARDQFDYTPLILASLCGHFEVVQLLLEAGALCERDTFQGERCLYNALNDRIRNLLLSYEYSKSADPLQPLAAHITSLLTREHPQTSDILVSASERAFRLHKFVLSARSPYFSKKLSTSPDTTLWKLSSSIPPQSFEMAVKHIYFGELPSDVGGGPNTGFTEDDVLVGIDKITKQLEIRDLWNGIIASGDRRIARQHRTDEIEKGQQQLQAWFTDNVIKHKIMTDTLHAENIKWNRSNGIFADVLLRADEAPEDDQCDEEAASEDPSNCPRNIPVGPLDHQPHSSMERQKARVSTLFPVHRAMLLRSDYFLTMFASGFREAQESEYLQIVNVDCSPEVLEIVLRFLYTEKADMPMDRAIDVLFAADHLLIEKLKMKAAVVVSTLGSGSIFQKNARLDLSEHPVDESDSINIYNVIRAGWLTRMPRLEEFGARYIAYKLERYIDEEEFSELVTESAQKITGRQETDTIELLDDVRYYLSERFRLRFEESGFEQLMDGEGNTQSEEVKFSPEAISYTDEAMRSKLEYSGNGAPSSVRTENPIMSGSVRTLDGELAGDESEGDAINYQILLGKIDALLERLKLDA